LVLLSAGRATTVIYPVGAIDDFWALPADQFRQKYGGINVSGIGPSDEGWYVRYRHENLTCLFGPLADREEARKRKWEMEAVRDAAIRNRSALSTSQVDFVRFTFSGVYGRAGDGTGGLGEMARVSADGRSGPDGDLDGDGIPNSKDDDMDGDGVPNDKDDDVDGDGVPNGQDGYLYGKNPNAPAGNGRDGPEGDLDGDGTANAKDGDMDGDGIPNAQDPDIDGDGIPNGQDDYPYGNAENAGAGGGEAKMAGKDGSKSGGKGQDGQGSEGSEGQQISSGQKGQQQVASNQRGSQSGQQGRQQSQSGQQAGQQGSQQSQGQQSSSSSSQSNSQGGQSGPPSGSSGGGGNPVQLLAALLKAILGI
jgi:hypothetical protein